MLSITIIPTLALIFIWRKKNKKFFSAFENISMDEERRLYLKKLSLQVKSDAEDVNALIGKIENNKDNIESKN